MDYIRHLFGKWWNHFKKEGYPTLVASIKYNGPRRQTSAALEVLWREEAILEQPEKAKEFETSQDQICGEGNYPNPQDQALYNEHTLSLCSIAALNAWGSIQELGKRIESYIQAK